MSVGDHDCYVVYYIDNSVPRRVMYNASVHNTPQVWSDRMIRYDSPYGIPGGDEFVVAFLSRRVSR